MWTRTLVITFMAIGFTACVSNLESKKTPGADLSSLKTFYVQRPAGEGRGVERLITDRLIQMGLVASYGSDGPATPVDAIVTYKDQWWWDLSWYMIQLDVQIRDAQTTMILANGQSIRSSLVRKSSDEMVDEVLTELFKGTRR